MKRKVRLLVCLALAVMMVAAFSATALAASSPVGGTSTVTGLPENAVENKKDLFTDDLAKQIADKINLGTKGKVVDIFELNPTVDGVKVGNGSYTVTVDVNTTGYSRAFIYKAASMEDLLAGKYTIIEGKIVDGKVVFTVDSFSVFAVVMSNENLKTTADSPKTGQADYTALLIAIAAVGACGMVFAARKAGKATK